MQFLGFGNSSSEQLTISSDTAWSSVSGIVATGCSGDAGENLLVVDSSTGFSANDIIIIHHSRGTTGNTGGWELNQVLSVGGATSLNLTLPLANSYTDSGADQSQVQRVPQYSGVKVNSSVSLSAGSYDGSTKGIIAFLSSGVTQIQGTLSASGKGYRGGNNAVTAAYQGEGTAGGNTSQSTAANGTGGGGGGGDFASAGGGGGGHATAGTNAGFNPGEANGRGIGGGIDGSATFTSGILMGGGGGGGERGSGQSGTAGAGGIGGGLIFIFSRVFTVTGSVVSNGDNGGNYVVGDEGGGGGAGAGGSIFIKGQTLTLGNNLITATGGIGGDGSGSADGGNGGTGRIRVESCSITDIATYATNPATSVQTGGYNFCGGIASIIL